MLLLTGLNEAFMGTVRQFNTEFSLYNYEKVIEILMEDAMNREEAEEYFEYNIVGAWVGDETPGFYYMKDGHALNNH